MKFSKCDEVCFAFGGTCERFLKTLLKTIDSENLLHLI